jgi:hypothetical protein
MKYAVLLHIPSKWFESTLHLFIIIILFMCTKNSKKIVYVQAASKKFPELVYYTEISNPTFIYITFTSA